MKYILMAEDVAIEKGIIEKDHSFRCKDNQIVFKRDMITYWEMKGNRIDFDYEELTIEQALKTIDTWQ